MKRCLATVTLLFSAPLWGIACSTAQQQQPPPPPPAMRVVTTGLNNPWAMVRGPDGRLWVTEKTGRRVVRVSPADGSTTTAVTIPDVAASGAQDGLLGIALHPGLLRGTGEDYVYLAYSYDADPGPAVDLRGKIVRYTYEATSQTLRDPVDVITGLPASRDHNAGRLVFGPDRKLYYSVGDQGNNQFDRACLPIRAQDLPNQAAVAARDWSTYAGKILRLNPDGSIPADNPVIHGVRSHIFSYGHRNPQGLVFGPGARLFSDEHGPKSDDEINLIQAGKNYGWPYVAGFRDDQAYVYANWSASVNPPCAQLHYSDYEVPPSVPQQQETAWSDPDYVEPLKTLYTVPTGHNFQDPACGEQLDLCWPSVAPSSIDYVPADKAPIPAMANALLVTSLKNGAVYVLKLTQDGGSVQGDVVQFFRTANRYRDVLLNPDDGTVYVATDSDGLAGPQSGSHTGELANPGAILAFTPAAAAGP